MRFPSLALVIAPVLLLACESEPVAPDPPTPSLSATHGELVFEGTDDDPGYNPCANDGLGETVHWLGDYRITIETVTSNSGNEHWRYKAFEYPGEYRMTGLTSGDVWIVFEVRRANSFIHFLDNGNLIRNFVLSEDYENQYGERMNLHYNAHFTYSNGAWHAERGGVVSCKLY
jgi:hypothetical protein